MKQIEAIVPLLVLSFVYACSNGQSSSNAKQATAEVADFDLYINSLDTIKLPFLHKSFEVIPMSSQNYDEAGFNAFKHAWTIKPVGILYTSDSYIVTMEYNFADIGHAPFLISYEKSGTKIDSLGPYKSSGYDMGYEANEDLTIDKEGAIKVVAHIKKWEINEEENRVISGTMKESTEMTKYIVTESGHFKKIE